MRHPAIHGKKTMTYEPSLIRNIKLKIKVGISWCCVNYFWFVFVLYCLSSFESIDLRHLMIATSETPKRLPTNSMVES